MHKKSSFPLQLIAVLSSCLALTACGGGGDDDIPISVVSAPGVPTNLTANVGPAAISLGWDAPTNNGGAAIQTYEIEVTPTVSAANITVTGTRALIRNLATGSSYTFAVRARNGTGTGAASPSITVATIQPSNPGAYTQVTVTGDNSASGIFDPSVLRVSNNDVWMSYSSVNYHSPNGVLTKDVGIRLARSLNGGAFAYQGTVVSPSDVTLTGCGLPNCDGRWVYETSWLIDDATDPVAARRYKVFAHKYFLKPGNMPSDTLYHLGAISMWTSGSLSGPWVETSLLGWNLTPTVLNPLRNVNLLSPALADCLVVNEGSASVRGNIIDFVFACPESNGVTNPQKIVMLRSTDHASTFQYVSTLLSAADATPDSYFSAPALLSTAGSAPVLLVTPVAINGVYSGCFAVPFADDATGALFRVSGVPAGLLYTPPQNNGAAISGACAYDRGLGTRGILLSNTIAGATPFAIYATQAVLQP